MLTISPIRNNVNFGHYKNTVYNKAGDIAYRGDTCLFRCDLDFNALISFIQEKYKDVPKVKIIAHACSAGHEAYSFLAILNDILGIDKAKKYLPIIARDIDKEHIRIAKNGYFEIMSPERNAIDFYLGDRFNNYFENINHDYFKNFVHVKNNLKSQVKFEKSDITKDVNKTNFKNTILFARNFWPYLRLNLAEKLAMDLSHRMDSSSLLVVGDYDSNIGIKTLLQGYGFRETEIENVFERNIAEKMFADKSYFQALKMLIKKQM